MSGSTQVSHRGRLYRLTLMTPSIHFAIDPQTGYSGEREYHDRAHADFTAQLERLSPALDRAIEAVAAELGLLPWTDADHHSGPARQTFWVGAARLEVTFARPLSSAEQERAEARLREGLQPVLAEEGSA